MSVGGTPARALRISLATAARRALADRPAFLVTLGIYMAVVTVLGSLWQAAADANGGAVAGYTAAALFWYAATSEAVTIPVSMRLIDEIGDDIASGSITVELLRPASVLAVRVVSELGRALPRLAACSAVGTALAWTVAGPPPDPWGLVLAAPAVVMAITASLVAQHLFAALAFWIRDAGSAWFLYQKLVFILGGMLLPLEVLPDGLATVARYLPFMAMAYAPARLASGHVDPELLAVQASWLVVLAAGAAATFAAGERRLQVVGG